MWNKKKQSKIPLTLHPSLFKCGRVCAGALLVNTITGIKIQFTYHMRITGEHISSNNLLNSCPVIMSFLSQAQYQSGENAIKEKGCPAVFQRQHV